MDTAAFCEVSCFPYGQIAEWSSDGCLLSFMRQDGTVYPWIRTRSEFKMWSVASSECTLHQSLKKKILGELR